MPADVDRPKGIENVSGKGGGQQVSTDFGSPERHKVVERLLGDRHGYDQSNMAGEVAEHEREQDQRTQEPGTRANEPCNRNQMCGTSRF